MTVEVVNGVARIGGRRCSTDSREVLDYINKGKTFYLGEGWECKTSPITGFVKIIKRK